MKHLEFHGTQLNHQLQIRSKSVSPPTNHPTTQPTNLWADGPSAHTQHRHTAQPTSTLSETVN